MITALSQLSGITVNPSNSRDTHNAAIGRPGSNRNYFIVLVLRSVLNSYESTQNSNREWFPYGLSQVSTN